jgi:hypothetical protein
VSGNGLMNVPDTTIDLSFRNGVLWVFENLFCGRQE